MAQFAPNPYQPPTSIEPMADSERARDGSASRMSRFWAAMIDGVLAIVIFVPLQYFAGVYRDFPKISEPPFWQSLLWALAGLAITLVLHGTFLARSAQTIGKKALGIQIVNASDGKPAAFGTIALRRLLPMSLVALIPYVGGVLSIINPLFIFRKDRRCVHDHIAGTRVVKLDRSK
ncbi:RDD family protein [Sorangium atrum]|uniref:RDD family protein n=1 Tax=Sorangium atrum TaxID=2995308 RepID=A0ABT5BY82_9BACT|nr:RDD family protein [Sorangium aterium]MDC0679104.1 RDD family protein [Sorangium aterium]